MKLDMELAVVFWSVVACVLLIGHSLDLMVETLGIALTSAVAIVLGYTFMFIYRLSGQEEQDRNEGNLK